MTQRATIRAAMSERPIDDPARTEHDTLMNDEWFRYRAGPELAAMQRTTIAS